MHFFFKSENDIDYMLSLCAGKVYKYQVENISYAVTVHLISSLMPFSFNAELVFYFRKNTRIWMFSLILFICKCDLYVLKYPMTPLRLFDVKIKKNLNGHVI